MPRERREHFKAQGQWDGTLHRIGKKAAGRCLDGREWDELPTFQRDEVS